MNTNAAPPPPATTHTPRLRTIAGRLFALFDDGQNLGTIPIALLILAAAAFLLRDGHPVIAEPQPPPTNDMRVVMPGPEQQLKLRGEIELHDTEPLYLPTRWNYDGYTQEHLNASRRHADIVGLLLEPFEPELRVREGTPLPVGDMKPPPLPALSDLLPLRYWRAAATIGAQARPGPEAPPPRQAFLSAERTDDGTILFEEEITLAVPQEELGTRWQPAAFSFWVDLQGPVGAPVDIPWIDNIAGPGNTAILNAMRQHLTSEEFAARFPPGHYIIRIGP